MCADIIDTRRKRYTNGFTKTPLDRLRPRFDHEKSLLLVSIAAIRAVPVAIVGELSALSAGDTPMSNLMERAADEVGAEVDAMRYTGLVVRLRCTANEFRLVARQKHAIEQTHQLTSIEWFGERHLRAF